MQSKITSNHLSRQAYIYVRQSSISQVKDHQESQRLQYKIAQRAQQLGWKQPVIIDEDLGRSGSGSSLRPGFSQLLTSVCEDKVGAIFCLEASRLARNNREWYQLVDFCAVVKTLIIDFDGIYDPCNVSDRVLLGVKGTVSEYELGIFRQRAQAAIRHKAERGEFYTRLPAGYMLTHDNRCDKDPDQRVRDAIDAVFKKFRELGSANQVVLYFRSESIELPVRNSNGKMNDIIWKQPTTSTISKILKNPSYAGAYVYGRQETRVAIVAGRPIKTSGHHLPMERWKVTIKNHHDGYISWDDFIANQNQLQQNATKRGSAVTGAPKRGPALLVGLLRCQRCGRKFDVKYKGVHSDTPRYVCQGQTVVGREGRCIEFYGSQLEALVQHEIMRVIAPAAIVLAEQTEQLYYLQQHDKEQHISNNLAHAEYEANRCFEQYNLADPKNRMVAQNLENHWEQALEKVEQLNTQLEQIRASYQPLSSDEKQMIYQLAQDLPFVWHHPKTDVRIKKRVLQILIKEIMVDIDADNFFMFSIHWTGGKHTQYQLKRRKRGERQNQLHPETETIIHGLAELTPDREIARILNLLKITTASGKTWIASRVVTFRQQHKIVAFNPVAYQKKGLVNLTQTAEILGIQPMAVYRLIKANIINGRQVVRYAPWAIEKEHLNQPSVQQTVAALKKGSKIPLTKNHENQNQLTL
jgi:DNA invertase Pin-like site-specific DNA recombinase